MRQYKTTIIAAFAALSCAASAYAQNLNPVVEVSRAYQGKLLEMDKPQMRMAVPDSLLKVDLDFDYSVFETPYQGAYEFKPYLMDMKPQPDAFTGRNLYLRAGAGLSFNPEATLIYSPTMKGDLQMSLYGMHQGFFGSYREIAGSFSDGVTRLAKTDNRYKGHDMSNSLGISARADWSRVVMTMDLGYRGIGTRRGDIFSKNYNALDLSARLRTNTDQMSYFMYDVAVGVRAGADKLKEEYNGMYSVGETVIDINSTLGPVLDYSNKFLVDVDMTLANYSGIFQSNSGVLSVTPKWVFDHNRWDLSLGLRLSSLIRGNADGSIYRNHMHKAQNIYPVATVSFEAIYGRLVLYSQLKGGENINTYSSILEKNHNFSVLYAVGKEALLDNSVERFNVSLGAKGNFAEKFQYDLRGGFVKMSNGLLESCLLSTDEQVIPTVSYVDYNSAYTDALFSWNPGHFQIDGKVGYQFTNLSHKHTDAFAPALMTTDIRIMYDWNSRVFAGVRMASQSSRKRYSEITSDIIAKVPGFVDLGIMAEYQFSRKLSFFAQGGNLLNMATQRNVGYAGPGINFTVGACLSL